MQVPMEAVDGLNDTLRAYEAIEDLLCELPDMHIVGPNNLCSLMRILREKAKGEVARLQGAPLKVAA